MNLSRLTRRSALLGGVSLLASCGSRFLTYTGPEVTGIVVYKGQRKMYLMHDSEVLKSYDFELGFSPVGHKQIEGDGKTPEGLYYIDRKNPNSSYHLSVGISYPCMLYPPSIVPKIPTASSLLIYGLEALPVVISARNAALTYAD